MNKFIPATSNIDPAELDKFSVSAGAWWNKDGVFKTLHEINPVRLEFIKSNIALTATTVLDIGCGGGLLTEAMAREGARVSGIDASHTNIMAASDHARENGIIIDYIQTTAEEHSTDHNDKYDLITCMELLEHVPEPTSIIKACASMIKPGGHVILSTINRTIKAYFLAVIAGEYMLGLLPKGTHQYKNFIRPAELVRWCRDNGLQLNALKGLQYNPLRRTCILDNHPSINYIIDTVAT